jgi:hypothetical protein
LRGGVSHLAQTPKRVAFLVKPHPQGKITRSLLAVGVDELANEAGYLIFESAEAYRLVISTPISANSAMGTRIEIGSRVRGPLRGGGESAP